MPHACQYLIFKSHLDNARVNMLELLFSPKVIRHLDSVFLGPFYLNDNVNL